MTKKTRLIVLLALSLNILIVWLPTGFQTAGIQEEGRIRAFFDGNITTYGDSGNPTTDEIFITRPIIGVLNRLTYILTPDSFLSHHLILIGLLLVKGFVLFLIINTILPNFPLWGYLGAVMLVFYPSDPAVVSLRVIHTHLAIVMILLSIFFLLRYYQESKRHHLILMWISQAIAGLTIEIGYPLFLFSPLILLIIEKRISKRVIVKSALFYIVPAITFFYSIFLILVVQVSWQRTAIGSYTIREYLKNILNLYEYNLVTAWQSNIDYLTSQATISDLFVFLASTLVTLGGSLLVARHQQKLSINPTFLKIFGLMLLGGLTMILLGYATFLPSRTHVLTNYRVYLLSSIGLAIVISTLIYGLFHLISRYPVKYLALLAGSVLVGLSCVFANKTHHDYLEISDQHESLVRQIAEVVPALKSDAHIVIKMPSNGNMNRLSLGEIQKPVLFTPLLQYIYNDYNQIQAVVLCFTSYLDCEFTSDGMAIHASNFLNIDLPIQYEQLILFNVSKRGDLTLIEQDDTLTGYDPVKLIDTAVPQPRRMEAVYGASD